MEEENELVRCFVALDLPREVMNHIHDIQNQIKKQNLFTGKFTDIETLHLTLKFLGEIDSEKVEEVKKKLREIKFPAFEARLGNVGTFGERGYIRVVWIELIGAYNLQKQIDSALNGLFQPEFRFMGHITLARVKSVGDKKALLEYIKHIKPKDFRFNVDKFFLKKSTLMPEGPVYEDLESYQLEEKK